MCTHSMCSRWTQLQPPEGCPIVAELGKACHEALSKIKVQLSEILIAIAHGKILAFSSLPNRHLVSLAYRPLSSLAYHITRLTEYP
jgi:hypothetical protein